NEAVAEVLALSSSELQRSRVAVQTDFAQDLPAVRGDRVQLQQVILNLILNAVEVLREMDNRHRLLVVTPLLAGNKQVRFSLRDNAKGFEGENPEKLFEHFYTTKEEGMGIGLSISRSIIESHEGRLWAENSPDGRGAVFAFSIPCNSDVAAY